MLHLFIETASERALAALFRGNKLVASCLPPPGLGATRAIMPGIDAMFKEKGIAPRELAFVGVGIGPGSFTGLRVGVAIAKGLALGLSLPLVGIGSLEGYIDGIEGR